MATCPKCRHYFRVLEDEDDGQHGCPSCGYTGHDEPQQSVRYTLSLTGLVPFDAEYGPPTDAKDKRNLERTILKALRVLEGDWDCEVLETVVEEG